MKSFGFPFLIIIYGEFTTLLVDRSYGIGTSTPTFILKWFGGGKVLLVFALDINYARYRCAK